jgi:hypothetical protein
MEIDAAAYLRQADEIFARETASADGITHPEAYIRARAVRLWHENHPDAERLIAQMIEGNPALDDLDLLGQQRSAQDTRRLIEKAADWRHAPDVRANRCTTHGSFRKRQAALHPSLPIDDSALVRGPAPR